MGLMTLINSLEKLVMMAMKKFFVVKINAEKIANLALVVAILLELVATLMDLEAIHDSALKDVIF